MAIIEVKVPQLSESVAEATLLQWKKKVGDAVAVDEILIDVETDKVVLEVPAPSAGVLVEIIAAGGATVMAEQLIARIDTTATASAAGPISAAAPPAKPAAPAAVSAAVAAPTAPAAPKPPAPPAVAVPKPPGSVSLPGAAGAAATPPQVPLGTVAPANDFGKKLEAAALKNAELDPAARQLSEEQRITDKMALKPEERKVYEEGIAGLQKMYQEQYDPERQRQEGLKRALIGAGGRRYGELAGAASAGMDYDTAQRNAKLKEFGDVQAARTGLIGLDRANVKGGIDAGTKAYEQSSMSQRQGLESGRGLYGEDVKSRDTKYSIDVKSRDDALNREIDRLKVEAQRDATAASRESLSYDRSRTVYSATLGKIQELERRLDEDLQVAMVCCSWRSSQAKWMLRRKINWKPQGFNISSRRPRFVKKWSPCWNQRVRNWVCLRPMGLAR